MLQEIFPCQIQQYIHYINVHPLCDFLNYTSYTTYRISEAEYPIQTIFNMFVQFFRSSIDWLVANGTCSIIAVTFIKTTTCYNVIIQGILKNLWTAAQMYLLFSEATSIATLLILNLPVLATEERLTAPRFHAKLTT